VPLSRRSILAAPLALAAQSNTQQNSEPKSGPLIDTHIHLFAADTKRFPYHQWATYKPQPATLEDYLPFAKEAGIDGVVIVHPEPYQDDHRYLEYCFLHEPSKDFFKGTCLFDAQREDTPKRIQQISNRWAGRVRALRIHNNQDPTMAPTMSGSIRDRDLRSAAMRRTWTAASDRGLMMQMHFTPPYAKYIFDLAKDYPRTIVILDHLGRSGQGTPEQWKDILALAKLPNTVMKISGIPYSSKEPWPHRDAFPRVREAFDAFGAERLIWGSLGHDKEAHAKARQVFNEAFAFTNESARARIRGVNAQRLYGWS
jgi:predicted TIM-barrel fold metal-dependent hydrolase